MSPGLAKVVARVLLGSIVWTLTIGNCLHLGAHRQACCSGCAEPAGFMVPEPPCGCGECDTPSLAQVVGDRAASTDASHACLICKFVSIHKLVSPPVAESSLALPRMDRLDISGGRLPRVEPIATIGPRGPPHWA